MNNIIAPNCAADEEVQEEPIESMEQLDNLFGDEAPEEPTKKEEPVEEAEEVKEEEQAPAEIPKVQPTKDSFTRAEEQKANQAFAAMRARLSEQDKMLQKVADARGVSLDMLKEQLNKEAVETAAKQMNVSPEVYKRLSDLEEESRRKTEELEAMKRADIENKQRSYLVTGMESIQKEFGLSDQEAASSVNEMIKSGYDILSSKIPLEVIYKGINLENIVSQRVEAARQEWLSKDAEASAHSSTPVKGTGKDDNSKSDIMTMDDLDALFDK